MNEKRLTEIKNELTSLGYANIEHSAPGSELLSKYYKEIFDEALCTTCGKRYEAYYKILNLTTQNSNIMAKGKFSIKNNGMIDIGYDPIEGVPQHITNANVTDDIYHKLVKANPNFKSQFVEDPNFVPDENATVKTSKKAAAETPTEEPVNRAAEIEVSMTKDEIVSKLEKLRVDVPAGAKKAELAQLLADNEKK